VVCFWVVVVMLLLLLPANFPEPGPWARLGRRTSGTGGARVHVLLLLLRLHMAPPGGRGLHSSSFQLNLNRFWSLKPQQASTSQLSLTHFCRCDFENSPRKVLTSSRKMNVRSPQKVPTLS
jgi:hypothetical protein